MPFSNRKVWWVCTKGHEWQANIKDRSNGNGCPYCSGKKVCRDNSLKTLNPVVASEWDYRKNGDLTPGNVTVSSKKKVWWKCKKGHEWLTTVAKRTEGKGCPYCKNKKVCKDNCLATVNPSLAKQWHPSRNGKLTPKDVTAGSGKKVWWMCKKGHVWQNTVTNRNHGTGCPKCRYINSQVG